MNVIYFLRSICKEKTFVYILKPCIEIGRSLEERLREDMPVKNLEIFCMDSSHHIQPPLKSAKYIDLAKPSSELFITF